MDGTTALGLAASGVFLVRLLPQPLRLARTGVTEGVSVLSAFNALTSAIAWLVYGLLIDDPVVWVVSALAVIPGVWTAALLWRRAGAVDLALAGFWAGAVVASGLVGALAVALPLGVLVMQGPQVVEAVRDPDLSGLAPATWWISFVDAATWGAYGVATGDPALLGYAATLSLAAAVVLTRLAVTRRAAPGDWSPVSSSASR